MSTLGNKMLSVGQITIFLLLILALAGCIAPLPVKSIADPWVRGTILNNGVATANVEVRLDHRDDDACDDPRLRTLTDSNGKFAFEGKMRAWSWLGWANNHYVYGCVLTPDGPRPFGMRAANEPKYVELECDIEKASSEMCKVSCIGGFKGRC